MRKKSPRRRKNSLCVLSHSRSIWKKSAADWIRPTGHSTRLSAAMNLASDLPARNYRSLVAARAGKIWPNFRHWMPCCVCPRVNQTSIGSKKAGEIILRLLKDWRQPTLAEARQPLPLARLCLTAVFGMGTGRTTALWPPNCLARVQPCKIYFKKIVSETVR